MAAAGRRTSLASLAGGMVETVPGASDPLLMRIALSQLAPTRFNPRRNFGTEEQMLAFGRVLQKKQLQPAVVVSRAGYLKLWPEETKHVGDKPLIIVNGERRYRASSAVGLEHLNVVHDETLTASRAVLLDAILSENNDRENLDPIERALGIETMVEQIGGASKVAEHYGKTQGWVSQQRKLLKLVPELQDLVSSAAMPVRVARDIAGLPAGEQVAAWQRQAADREASKASPQRRVQVGKTALRSVLEVAQASAQPEAAAAGVFTAVKTPASESSSGTPPAGTATPEAQTPEREADSAAEQEAVPESIPDPRTAETRGTRTAAPAQIKMPWHDGEAVAVIAIHKMTREQLLRLKERLAEEERRDAEQASATQSA
ncbi:ParB/RepB/Spo0J family partition protein [Streptomyces hypolithicus]